MNKSLLFALTASFAQSVHVAGALRANFQQRNEVTSYLFVIVNHFAILI